MSPRKSYNLFQEPAPAKYAICVSTRLVLIMPINPTASRKTHIFYVFTKHHAREVSNLHAFRNPTDAAQRVSAPRTKIFIQNEKRVDTITHNIYTLQAFGRSLETATGAGQIHWSASHPEISTPCPAIKTGALAWTPPRFTTTARAPRAWR